MVWAASYLLKEAMWKWAGPPVPGSPVGGTKPPMPGVGAGTPPAPSTGGGGIGLASMKAMNPGAFARSPLGGGLTPTPKPMPQGAGLGQIVGQGVQSVDQGIQTVGRNMGKNLASGVESLRNMSATAPTSMLGTGGVMDRAGMGLANMLGMSGKGALQQSQQPAPFNPQSLPRSGGAGGVLGTR